jgi:DNA repair protein RecO (recombination protein O)
LKQQSKGIFIHKSAYSESSLIVSFYTEDAGMQRFLFQGGKKKAAGLFPCSICEITYYRRPDSELGKLTEAQIYSSLSQVPFNPVHGTVAFFFADIIRNVLKSETEDRDLFLFLCRSIQQMDELKTQDLSLFVIYFLIRLTEYLGIEPQVQAQHKRFFMPSEGLFTDLERLDTITFSGEGVALIQNLLSERTILEVSSIAKKDALDILLTYFRLHIPNFNVDRTLDILRELLYN